MMLTTTLSGGAFSKKALKTIPTLKDTIKLKYALNNEAVFSTPLKWLDSNFIIYDEPHVDISVNADGGSLYY